MTAYYQHMDLTGQRVGSYLIQGCIGEGGMGTVYLAIHPSIRRKLALKVLQPHFARDREMCERFLREARAASRISNPGIVEILDFGYTADGLPFLVMEYIKGRPLSEVLKVQGRLSILESVRIGREIAFALRAAHRKKVIHRDLKPENIMRLSEPDKSGMHIKILDFGIACMDSQSEAARLTCTGAFLGTPPYMAPEVIHDARQASERSDVYALGAVLYQMLVGETPFTGPTPAAILFKILKQAPPAASERAPEIPPALCALLKRLLAKRPEKRMAMHELGKELLEIERSLSCAARKSSMGRGGAKLGLLARLLAWTIPSVLFGMLAAASNQQPAQNQVRPEFPRLNCSQERQRSNVVTVLDAPSCSNLVRRTTDACCGHPTRKQERGS